MPDRNFLNAGSQCDFAQEITKSMVPFDTLRTDGRQRFAGANSLVDWIDSFLTHPNFELKRTGAVCPFVRTSMLRKRLFVSHVRLSGGETAQTLKTCVEAMTRVYDTDPRIVRGEVSALILALPAKTGTVPLQAINDSHRICRAKVNRAGIALGEFHPNSQTPSARNSNFFTMRAPLPLFVLREISEHDLMFVDRADFPYAEKYETLQSILTHVDRIKQPHLIKIAEGLKVKYSHPKQRAAKSAKNNPDTFQGNAADEC